MMDMHMEAGAEHRDALKMLKGDNPKHINNGEESATVRCAKIALNQSQQHRLCIKGTSDGVIRQEM